MNKYDKKLLEIIEDKDAIVYVLLQKKIRGRFLSFLDFFLDGVFTAADMFKHRGAHYLMIEDERSVLIQIDRHLNVSQNDVTDYVKKSWGKKSFEYGRRRYELFRKFDY